MAKFPSFGGIIGDWVATRRALKGLVGERRLAFLPIETSVREFDARLLVGLELSSRGFHVLIGNPGYLAELASALGAGVFFDKDFGDHNPRHRSLASRTLLTCAIDEEGVNYISEARYIFFRHLSQRKALSDISSIMAWGQEQGKMLSRWAGDQREKICVTGSARTDLLSGEFREYFSDDVRRLTDQNRNFVLIATSLPGANYAEFYGANYLTDMRRSGLVKSSEEDLFLESQVEHQVASFEAFIQLVGSLSSRFPTCNFVIRPHPSESTRVWKEKFSTSGNVSVSREGSVIPWILASEALIHSGSTTGIEAFLLDKPVISFGNVGGNDFEDTLVNSLGVRVSSPEEVVEVLKLVLSGEDVLSAEDKDRQKNSLRPFLNSMDGDFGYIRIADKISDLAGRIPAFSREVPAVLRQLSGFRVKAVVRKFARQSKILPLLFPKAVVVRLLNVTEKFPVFTRSEVDIKLSKFVSLAQTLLSKKPFFELIGTDVVLIMPSLES